MNDARRQLVDLAESKTQQTVRREIIARLNRTAEAWRPWSNAPRLRPPCVFDDFFKALADAGDFNRRNPHITIPALVDWRVPMPQLGPPLAQSA